MISKLKATCSLHVLIIDSYIVMYFQLYFLKIEDFITLWDKPFAVFRISIFCSTRVNPLASSGITRGITLCVFSYYVKEIQFVLLVCKLGFTKYKEGQNFSK